MSYTINKTNGQLILTLLDGTADGPSINPGLNSLDINLFGKNYPTYGEFQNENFVKLLENFSNSTAPLKPIKGQLWYDSLNGFLKVYNGSQFKTVSPITVSPTEPLVTNVGDQWWDTTNDQFRTFNGTTWEVVGPAFSKLDGKSGALVETVYDTNGGTKHTVVKFYTNDNLSAIASYDPEFTPNVAIPGFTSIRPGITLSTVNSGLFVGTATNAQLLDNIDSSQFARKDGSETFAGNVSIASGSLAVTMSTNARITNTQLGGHTSFYNNVNGTSVRALHIDATDGRVYVAQNPIDILGVVTKQYADNLVSDAVAPLATTNNPALTGIPTAPTASTDTNSTQIATTEFTKNAIAAADNGLWKGSNKFVSSSAPTSGTGVTGDFWFQI
jgi:hypothetical protein